MHERISFGPFELDVTNGRLLKRGTALRLVGQPLQVLAILLERPGEIVSRDELRTRLWGSETFVDFEHGLNAAVNKLRFTLGDAAGKPRYIETVPRRGYRFACAVSRSSSAPIVEAPSTSTPAASPTGMGPWSKYLAWTAAVAVAIAAIWAGWVTSADSPPASIRSERMRLVVLPFQNLSDDREQEYFSEALTGEMITRLGQLDPERLGIIAQTSASRYRSPVSIRRIAAELDVDYAVEGTVRRSGDRVTVNARLIRAADESLVWTESYDRSVSDLLALQRELARVVAERIDVSLPQGDRLSPSPAAYEAYLRGRYLLGRRTAAAAVKGHAYLMEAVRLDPSFALGWAELSVGYQQLAYRSLEPAEAMPRALAAAQRSLALDPGLSEGHAALATYYSSYAFDWKNADGAFRRALELHPNAVETRTAYAAHLSHVGNLDQAVAEITRALQLDPVSLSAQGQHAIILYRARRYREAADRLATMSELDPNYPVIYLNRGLLYAAEGRYREAIEAFEAGRRLDPGSADMLALLGYARGRAGDAAGARAALAELHRLAAAGFVQPFTFGLVHLGLGEHDEALAWLERSYEERSWMTALIFVNPELDPLRQEPRFEALISKLLFPG